MTRADLRGDDVRQVFAGERPVIDEAAAIARKTDSEPPRTICAWCPDFTPNPKGTDSHGICPACYAKLNADLDRHEASQ